MISGVCGGLGHYFGIDSTLIRLFFAIGFLFGLSPLVYLILWIVMPVDQQYRYSSQQQQQIPPAALPQQQQMPQQDPTGEWRYDPYTGEPIRTEQQQ
jgi:phage shock protein C